MQRSIQQDLPPRRTEVVFHYNTWRLLFFMSIHDWVFGLGTNVAVHRYVVMMSGIIRQAGR